MTTKSTLAGDFIEGLIPAICSAGYVRSSKNTFLKCFSADISAIIQFEFIGSGVIEAVCYYGSRVQSVEQRLQGMRFFSENELLFSNDDFTVFQRRDIISRIVTGANERSSFNITDGNFNPLNFYDMYLRDLEPSFCNVTSLAKYCLVDKSLPLGHHAFRVPLLLRDAGLLRDCKTYVREVLTGGFIVDYDKFAEELFG